MTKKKKNEVKEHFFSAMYEILFGKLKDQIISIVRDSANKINKAITDAATLILKLVFSGIIILIGFVMLIISFVYLSIEMLNLTLGQSLLIWSLILIFLGSIYALISSKKNQRESN